jgi:hypothetical protein
MKALILQPNRRQYYSRSDRSDRFYAHQVPGYRSKSRSCCSLTGLKGFFGLKLEFAPDSAAVGPFGPAAAVGMPDAVIDSVQKPTEN